MSKNLKDIERLEVGEYAYVNEASSFAVLRASKRTWVVVRWINIPGRPEWEVGGLRTPYSNVGVWMNLASIGGNRGARVHRSFARAKDIAIAEDKRETDREMRELIGDEYSESIMAGGYEYA